MGAAAESYKPALILLYRIKWTGDAKDTRKKDNPICPIYLQGRKKRKSGVLSVHTCACAGASLRRTMQDVSSGFSCEKGNHGGGRSKPLDAEGGDANVKSGVLQWSVHGYAVGFRLQHNH